MTLQPRRMWTTPLHQFRSCQHVTLGSPFAGTVQVVVVVVEATQEMRMLRLTPAVSRGQIRRPWVRLVLAEVRQVNG